VKEQLTQEYRALSRDPSVEYTVDEYINDHMLFGRSCPFCKVTGVWRSTGVPHVVQGEIRIGELAGTVSFAEGEVGFTLD
jgi:hypothetical protein